MAEFFHPPSRLKTLVRELGGVTVAEALRQAEQAVETMRDETLAAIDAAIEDAARLVAARGAVDLAKLYRAADAIYGDAGAFGLAELARTAHSLCDVVTLKPAAATRPIIKIFIDTMRALRSPELAADPAAREAVLAGLDRLADTEVTKP